MRSVTIAAAVAAAIAGCSLTIVLGGVGPAAAGSPSDRTATTAATPKGKKIVQRRSRFGRMLFDARGQAIYIFQKDPKGKSACYGECARLWPPVYTKARPRAGAGVRKSLLGTTRRRDGRLQVTYAGKPLYFYVNEGPNEVRCHNVFLNGGLWWVIGPDGRRRP